MCPHQRIIVVTIIIYGLLKISSPHLCSVYDDDPIDTLMFNA